MNNKEDTPIIQKIPSILGALCQDQEKGKICFLLYHAWTQSVQSGKDRLRPG